MDKYLYMLRLINVYLISILYKSDSAFHGGKDELRTCFILLWNHLNFLCDYIKLSANWNYGRQICADSLELFISAKIKS